MQIERVEIHEYEYDIPGVKSERGHWKYQPGSTLQSGGFILSIEATGGVVGNYRGFVHTPPMISQIEMVAEEYLLGRDPFEREEIWYDLWHRLRHTDHLGTGPIDIALWDLAGNHYDESVASLLGGFRDRLPAYASTFWADTQPDGLSTPAAYADFARSCQGEGYEALKIHPTGDPDQDVDICTAVADAVGAEMDLMLDPASEYQTYAEALRVGRTLDDLDFFWYEDPLVDTGESIALSKKLTRRLETPILGLEHVRSGPFGRADHLADGALDFVRASAHFDGGITGVMKIAHLAESFGCDVELHLGGAANIQCMAAIRNTNYIEHGLLHPQVEWVNARGLSNDLEGISDGEIPVPDSPGLGTDINWEFIEGAVVTHTEIG